MLEGPLESGRGRLNPGLAGLGVATVTLLLLLAWVRFETWYISGSAFTDLPGQDSLHRITALSPLVGAVIALAAGRLAGLVSRRKKWLAVLIGVLPLILLVLVGAHGSAGLRVWAILAAVYALGLFGAYAPGWPAWLRRRPR